MRTRTFLSLGITTFALIAGSSQRAPAVISRATTAVGARESLIDYDLGEVILELPAWSANDIIVKFREDIPEDYRSTVVQQYGCSVIDNCVSGDFQLVMIPESETAPEMVDVFQQDEAVEYAELNYYARITFVPNDTFYSFQWHLDNAVQGGINMEAAWDIQRGDPDVVIAVLDTGVAYEDFGTFKQAPDLANTPFVPGYDFANEDTHANDDQGHGTHVTGTIAQSTNNGLGVGGVAFGCSIMPVKVMDGMGMGNYFDIASGIHFAVDNGANVINMSLGGPADSATLRNAVAFAYERGVTVVCAAGNDFLSGNAVTYPAAYDDYCIAVGATRYDETRAYYSNTGSYLDIVAPGGDMLVDQNGDGYGDGILQQTFSLEPGSFAYWFLQGTSMAAPHVSGAAALIISNGVTSPGAVRQALEKAAKDIGPPGWDEEYGWGLLDVWSALNYGPSADLNGDSLINSWDLSLLAEKWLQTTAANLAPNLSGDNIVNFIDFAILAESWSK
ncbi:MAG: S8 family peptidase [Planctomycetota bacterium]|jgi:serine protease